MRSVRAQTASAVLIMALIAALTACSGGSSEPSAGPVDDPSTSEATEAPVQTAVTLGKLTGKLAKDKRDKTLQQVGEAVDAWIDAAYVGGDYPRNDFADSWPGFTVGATSEAKGDKALMSNQDIGDRISGVEATTRKVIVDILAVKRHAVGTTARVVLKFSTEGEVQRDVVVRGRLFLTWTPDGWRIFGYDVTKGRAA